MILLDGNQIRQFVDTTQLFTEYRSVQRERELRFKGSMIWKRVAGRDYLYVKKHGLAKGLGPRNADTERIYTQFRDGRVAIRERIEALDTAILRMAPINRAMRLGRVPVTSGKLLRRLERVRALGEGIRVAGTHALYAYEALAGIHFASEHVATMDIDLLYDARSQLRLLGSEQEDAGMLAQLQQVDPSFRPTEPGSFRAVSDAGFLVDLITPAPRNPATSAPVRQLGGAEDLQAVEIAGLAWLQNSPAVDRVAIDERGYPLRIVAPDPRAFAVHKAWLAERSDRDPLKRRRDHAQAQAVAAMVVHQLPELRFDDPALHFLPRALRETGERLAAEARARRFGPELGEGGWQ